MSGIYIHIPFCRQKCTYCDFHFRTNYQSYYQKMVDCIIAEIKLRKKEAGSVPVESIYLGGGTPSILKKADLKAILTTVKEFYSISPTPELTLECNPEDLDQIALTDWLELGVNRLSVGIQSFDDQDLTWMNRSHRASEAIQGVLNAQKAGFGNISIDLIYGLPEMTAEKWEKHLDLAIDLQVQHISSYCLTVEKKTALDHLVKTKKISPASPEIQSMQFEVLQTKLKNAGFIQYEISNFAREGYYSKHNSSYWKGIPYIGIGPSAHSYDGVFRSWNISNNAIYMKEIQKDLLPSEKEELSLKDQFNETILTGLRTIWGVSLERLSLFHLPDEAFYQKIKKLQQEDQLEVKNGYLYLTKKGMLFADLISSELFI